MVASMHTKPDIASASYASDSVGVPLGGAHEGRLVLELGRPHVEVSSDPRLSDLALARLDGERPTTITSNGSLTIRYAGGGIAPWLRHAHSPRVHLVLNAGIRGSLSCGEVLTGSIAELRLMGRALPTDMTSWSAEAQARCWSLSDRR
jgi:hypothetical protein